MVKFCTKLDCFIARTSRFAMTRYRSSLRGGSRSNPKFEYTILGGVKYTNEALTSFIDCIPALVEKIPPSVDSIFDGCNWNVDLWVE